METDIILVNTHYGLPIGMLMNLEFHRLGVKLVKVGQFGSTAAREVFLELMEMWI